MAEYRIGKLEHAAIVRSAVRKKIQRLTEASAVFWSPRSNPAQNAAHSIKFPAFALSTPDKAAHDVTDVTSADHER